MARSDDHTLLLIINKLQALGCDELETLEPQWVHSVLVSPGRTRQNLLRWVITRLSPSEYSKLSSLPNHAQEQKILQILICVGICLPGDTDIVEGSAPEVTQLKFWKTCLDVIEHLQDFSQPRHKERIDPQDADLLLSHLAHSSHLLPTLREEVMLVPEDLQDKYHAWCRQQKHTPVSDSLRKVNEQLSREQEKHNYLEKCKAIPSAEEHQSLQASVEKALSSLAKEQEVLRDVYSTHIAPWTTSSTQLELPNTGPLVEEADSKLSTLLKALKTSEEMLENCERLEEQKKAILREAQHPSSITTTLHSLVAKEGKQDV
ncbi:uncharacterized protein LOC123519581 [Portunus trituberculatus]|uniref:uncharacterized protein LOC123519581 n=1 Tax=Portunus trituberculatus TaxID=210409 RepID=UPI001E1CEF40|nr:uncharacterized protein LOC123519581 [Portunus trituberculatus]